MEENDDYIQMFKEPPLVKGIEITQDTKNKKSVKTSKSVSRTSLKLNTKIKPKSNSKDKESIISDIKSMNNIGIQIEQEEEKNDNNIPDIIIPSLPDDEIIEPEEPLPEEGKIPNPNFCKNYVYNLLNPSKEEKK